jgi:DNA polymerase delta subunit 3
MVRIVDMDQVSEDERNSEDGDMGMEGLGEETPVVGNDRGGEGGISGKGEGDEEVKLEKEEGLEGLDAEKVTRYGVVLVGEEGLEGELSGQSTPHRACEDESLIGVSEKKGLFEQGQVSIHVYSLSPAPVKVRSRLASRHLPLPMPSRRLYPSLYLYSSP